MNKIKIELDESLEDLCLDGLKILQSPKLYRFTSDAVILANFVKVKTGGVVVDLGTGSGIIATLVAHKNSPKVVYGIEIQKELAEMAKRSVDYNQMQNKIEIINCDMKELQNTQVREKFNLTDVDVVVCNPPYKKVGTAWPNQNESEKLARHEVAINLENIVLTAKSLLKFGGAFYVVCDSDRTAELIYYLKNNKLEPKRMFFTQSALDKKANLVFIKAVYGGKNGVEVLPMLVTNDKDGNYLETVKSMKF